MSGALAVPFTIVATVLPSNWGNTRLILAVMAVVFFLFTGYRLWARERAQRIALEKHLAPSLRFEFDPREAKFVSKTQAPDGFDMLYLRVLARAVSPTVKNCNAYLQRVSQWDGEQYVVLFDRPFPLPWSYEGPQSVQPKDLNHGVDAFLDVAWFADPTSGHIQFGLLHAATVLPDQFRAVLQKQILPFPERNLKLDLLIIGEDSENATLSLNIHRGHLGLPPWDQPQICWMEGNALRRDSNIPRIWEGETTMKPRQAAALALVGWFLFMPPAGKSGLGYSASAGEKSASYERQSPGKRYLLTNVDDWKHYEHYMYLQDKETGYKSLLYKYGRSADVLGLRIPSG
jgi:hypothetical protein